MLFLSLLLMFRAVNATDTLFLAKQQKTLLCHLQNSYVTKVSCKYFYVQWLVHLECAHHLGAYSVKEVYCIFSISYGTPNKKLCYNLCVISRDVMDLNVYNCDVNGVVSS